MRVSKQSERRGNWASSKLSPLLIHSSCIQSNVYDKSCVQQPAIIADIQQIKSLIPFSS